MFGFSEEGKRRRRRADPGTELAASTIAASILGQGQQTQGLTTTTTTQGGQQQSPEVLQQELASQMSSLIQMAAQQVACGPECQRYRREQQLKQRWVEAEADAESAPARVLETRRQYVEFKEGDPYYAKLREQEVREEVERQVGKMRRTFEKSYKLASALEDAYVMARTTQEDASWIHEKVHDEIASLHQSVVDTEHDITTLGRKAYYKTEALEKRRLWTRFWKWVYYISVYVFLLVALVSDTSPFSWPVVLFYGVLFLSYPFWIMLLLRSLMSLYHKLTGYIFPFTMFQHATKTIQSI